MPSAARPFTPELVSALVAAGVVLAPITLHTGVSSPESHEPPYAERYRVPATTARLVNEAHRAGHRVVAVGTTATRALETDARRGRSRPGEGWTELVITRSEEHTSELQSLMRSSYAVFCLKKKKHTTTHNRDHSQTN